MKLKYKLMTSVIALTLAACGNEAVTPEPATPGPAPSETPTQDAPPPTMDVARLMSEAVEPEGPGTQPGPYPDITITPAPGLPTHTIYYPENFAEAGELPVLIWGNGACRNDGRSFYRTLSKVASHGYFVVAVGLYDTVEGAPQTTGAQMIEALDWLDAGPALPDGLAELIQSDTVAMMGQSCGGLMTVEAAADPRVDTIGVINSGVMGGASPRDMSVPMVAKEDLNLIHSPALYINGGTNDVAYENSNDDFERLNHIPVFYGIMEGAGHFATHRHRNGGRFAEVITAWLDWQLKNDPTAEAEFVGEDCGLCNDPEWTVQRKGF